MSVKVMGRVWELDLPANEKFVLLALADHADHDGNNVFPGLELIAFKTGYTTQQVRRIERKLEKRGILIAVNRKPGKRIEYRIDTNIGVTRERLHTIKMSPPTESNPLHSDTSTPYISSTESTGINHQLEPSILSAEADAQVEKPKKQREPNPIFDAVALGSFKLTNVNGDKVLGARIGKLVKWLKNNDPELKPQTVTQFYNWYMRKNPDIAAPADVTKFAVWWSQFVEAHGGGEQKSETDKMFDHIEIIGGKPQ